MMYECTQNQPVQMILWIGCCCLVLYFSVHRLTWWGSRRNKNQSIYSLLSEMWSKSTICNYSVIFCDDLRLYFIWIALNWVHENDDKIYTYSHRLQANVFQVRNREFCMATANEIHVAISGPAIQWNYYSPIWIRADKSKKEIIK